MKMWKLASAILAISVLLVGCGTEKGNEANKTTGGNTTEEQPVTSEQPAADEQGNSAYPLTVSSTVASTEDEAKGTIKYEDVTFETKTEKLVEFDYGLLYKYIKR